jgi:hypothetical protein
MLLPLRCPHMLSTSDLTAASSTTTRGPLPAIPPKPDQHNLRQPHQPKHQPCQMHATAESTLLCPSVVLSMLSCFICGTRFVPRAMAGASCPEGRQSQIESRACLPTWTHRGIPSLGKCDEVPSGTYHWQGGHEYSEI